MRPFWTKPKAEPSDRGAPHEPNRSAEGRSSSGPLVRGHEPNRSAEGRSSSGPLVRGLEPNRSAEGRSSSGPLVRGLEPAAARLARIDAFVSATRSAIFVRRADNLLLVRPEKTLGINASGAALIEALYDRAQRPARVALSELAPRLGVDLERLTRDAEGLLEAIRAVMKDDFSPRPMLKLEKFNRKIVRYPILAEIALTYACQNRCAFCYAASPYRSEHAVMTTAQVKAVMARIFHEAHVPSLSFTGGEATLRKDLPELIRFGRDLGFRVNIITNGVLAGEPLYARSLVEAGLASAQVSLEGADAALHDRLVGRAGSFEATVEGVRNFKALGIHVHTNSTLCRENLSRAEEIVRFVARDLGLKTLSMNMMIRTGSALDDPTGAVSYTEVCARLPALFALARAEGLKLVWYSPIPYCIANPVLLGQGAKSCACVDGIVSVNPAGALLPCSSFDRGLGSLLEEGYEAILAREAASYWRKKEYLPPPCQGCPDADVCAGACPLYWDAAKSFDELPRARTAEPEARREWESLRRRGGSFGVPAPGRG
jgi:radical SAM protein with 4Fe4S-binding SPASM domain